MEKLLNTYKGKKVFLTGHTGFKGAWLLKILQYLGAEVKGYALPPKTTNDLFYKIDGENICYSVIGDIRDSNKLAKEIIEFQPDFVFHLAAQPLVLLSYEKPLDTFEINVIGTVNLLEALKLLKQKCTTVLITTDKVYQNREWHYPYRENDRLGGYDPYSASKACAEIVIDSYRNSFFNTEKFSDHEKAIAVGRAGNVIGGGDYSKNRIIPDIINSLEKGIEISVRNPNAVRPWQHVLEPLAGYLLLASMADKEPYKYSNAFNFGPYPQDSFSVKELVESAIQIWGKGEIRYETNTMKQHEAGLLKLDINKAIAELGWVPKLSARESIEWTISWYKQSSENKNDFTTSQIEKYFAL